MCNFKKKCSSGSGEYGARSVHAILTQVDDAAKKGCMRHRLGLWEKSDDGGNMLKLGRAGYVLYLRFMKAFHQKGFEMPVSGVCNPDTKTRRQEMAVDIDGVMCGAGIIRPRLDWQVDEFWANVKEREDTALQRKKRKEIVMEKLSKIRKV